MNTAPGRKLRIGIVGLGFAGGTLMAPAVAAHPRAEIAGAADLRADLREKFARDFGVETHADVAALCARPDIDAVYVATPHQLHKEHVVIAAEHGKHAIVEKPMALSLADCDAMITAVRRRGVHLVVGHSHSYDPVVGAMRRVIADGTFGRLAMINMWNYTDFLYRPRRPEELDTAKGGGILFNQLPHQVDVARLLCGAPVRSVHAVTGVLDPRRPTEGHCLALVDFDDGTAASMVYSGYDHFDSDEFHFWIGESGRAKTPGYGRTRKALAGIRSAEDEAQMRSERYGYGGPVWAAIKQADGDSHQPHFGVLIATCERADLRPSADGVMAYTDDGVQEIPVRSSHLRPGQADVIDEMCEAVLNGVAPLHDGTWGRATMEVCLAIQQSSRERRQIVLPRPC